MARLELGQSGKPGRSQEERIRKNPLRFQKYKELFKHFLHGSEEPSHSEKYYVNLKLDWKCSKNYNPLDSKPGLGLAILEDKRHFMLKIYFSEIKILKYNPLLVKIC